MKKSLLTLALAFTISALSAQQIKSTAASTCDIQVAFAISEGAGFGEYSVTRLVDLVPGDQFDFKHETFEARRIYSKVEHDEVFIVRFKESGITHFINARVADGYEAVLNGGCELGSRPFVSKDGILFIGASAN